MIVSEDAHEILEKYWTENREKDGTWRMKIKAEPAVADELRAEGYAIPSLEDFDSLELTNKGWNEAKDCVRRHRLAERLVADVFNMPKDMVHKTGCQWEHVLHKAVEENICTLLGHPDVCPHGSPIPEGECCRDNRRSPRKLVMPLSDCRAGEAGKVAYVRAKSSSVLNKLTAMGILPGLPIRTLSRTPTFLMQVGESQFAIDAKLASHIYIRLC